MVSGFFLGQPKSAVWVNVVSAPKAHFTATNQKWYIFSNFHVGNRELDAWIPPAHGHTVSELLRHADLALYRPKALGRSRSVVFESTMAANQRDYDLLERDPEGGGGAHVENVLTK